MNINECFNKHDQYIHCLRSNEYKYRASLSEIKKIIVTYDSSGTNYDDDCFIDPEARENIKFVE